MQTFAKFTHPVYKCANDIKDADVIAWAFMNPDKIEKIAFKF